MYKLFSSIPLLSTTERQANRNAYFFNRFISYNPYRKNISNYILSNNKNKATKLKQKEYKNNKKKKKKYKNSTKNKLNLNIDNINDIDYIKVNKLNIIYSLYKNFK